ncbi:MAG: hypothetical protein ACP5O6_09410 [Candidatus Baltobacteraceae bacterium]
MMRAVLLAAALASPSPAPSASPVPSIAPAPIATASATAPATASATAPATASTPAAAASPQATMQPISAFMQVPKGWTLDRRVRVLSAVEQIRFQAMKPYGGAGEAINVTEDDGPTTGTLETNVATALGMLKHFGTKFRLISSRASFVCAGVRPAWRIHYQLTLGPMNFEMLQYIARAPHGSFDAATYMRPSGSAADPEALAALGTFCPQDFVAPPAVPEMTSVPWLHAPLPVGWTAAASGHGLMPGSRVLGSASKKLPDGTMESYLVSVTSLQKYGNISGKPVPLAMVAQSASNVMLKFFAHSTLVSSAKVFGCGGSDAQWQFEIQTPMAFLVERLAQKQGQLVVVVYARPVKMVQPDPVAQTALDALCPSSSVASLQQP